MDKKSLMKSAYLDFRDGNWDQAVNKYRQLLEINPEDVNTLTMLGDIMVRKDQFTEALNFYKRGLLLVRRGGSDTKAEMLQRKLVKLDPDSLEDVGEEEKGEGNKEESQNLEQLRKAVAADNKNLEKIQKLAEALLESGYKKEAAEQYWTIGNALFNNRMYKKAEPVIKKVVECNSNHIQARAVLGEIYSKEGSDSDAKKEFLAVAERLVREGNLERGQMFAQKAIQLKSIEAHYYLGLVQFLKNQNEDAQKEFETLLKFKVNHQGALTHLAKIYIDQQRWDDTFKLYERLVKIDPKNADAYERMAEIALQQNNTELAKDKFSQAMDTFAAEEQWERAASCAHQAVKLAPGEHELYLKLAEASYNAGFEQQAAEACVALATVLDTEGQPQKAEEMRAKARELTGESPAPAAPPVSAPAASAPAPPPSAPTPPPSAAKSSNQNETQMMLNIADNYIQQGSLDEAIEVYQKILKTEPNNERVKNALTRVYAMFAGINPEMAVAKKGGSQTSAKPVNEKEEQRVQREARERALREAQVRSQRSTQADDSQRSKPHAKENELLHAVHETQGDEIAGDHQDEFMTVTVAEIYTKQGLLNEALKIYQKILEIEPGNAEAQMKKKELESKVAEQEKLRRQSEAREAEAKKATQVKPTPPAAESQPSGKTESKPKSSDDDQEPPSSGKGRRGRVSYV